MRNPKSPSKDNSRPESPVGPRLPATVNRALPYQATQVASKPTAVFIYGDIAQRAHDIYIASGHVPGNCWQNCQQAEKDLRELGTAVCQAEHRIRSVFVPDA
jgi:hypothetical protein